ncbi:hypothetical protein HPB49_007277 [Dermacentor silvarum]|uniref:Uncharacterized protein n=1 Tax=Dermacentor silvarum TaxID=543639 RepID=A0ACB8CDU7_DERSI|nr:hypothetical protein HPB49_007277 [Dermacentor silvarum]
MMMNMMNSRYRLDSSRTAMLWSLLRTWFLATTAFYALRPAVSTALFLVFGACDLLWMCLSIAAAVCLKGRSVLEIRERTEEPACLRDPALGTHEFATLDVREF